MITVDTYQTLEGLTAFSIKSPGYPHPSIIVSPVAIARRVDHYAVWHSDSLKTLDNCDDPTDGIRWAAAKLAAYRTAQNKISDAALAAWCVTALISPELQA